MEELIAVSQPLDLVVDRVEGWIEAIIQNLPNAIVALVVILIGWVAAKVFRNIVRRGASRYTENSDLVRLAGTLAGLTVLMSAAFVALSVLHLEKTVTTILAGAGVVGLALGFAFQDTAANFISGVAMAIRKPFDEGDLVMIGEDLAIVERIELRTTILRRVDGPIVMIPNKTVFQNRIVNYSAGNGRRVEVEIGVSYADDLDAARKMALSALESLDCVDRDRDMEFYWTEFGGSSINGVLRFWIARESMPQFLDAKSRAVVALKRAYDDGGVTIPFPIRTLDFGEAGGHTLQQVIDSVEVLSKGTPSSNETPSR